MTPLQEFEEKAAKIMEKTTKENAVKQAKKMYRLKMRLFPKIDVREWEIGPERCPLCRFGQLSYLHCVCPLGKDVNCCEEWVRLKMAITNVVMYGCNGERALSALVSLAKRIYSL